MSKYIKTVEIFINTAQESLVTNKSNSTCSMGSYRIETHTTDFCLNVFCTDCPFYSANVGKFNTTNPPNLIKSLNLFIELSKENAKKENTESYSCAHVMKLKQDATRSMCKGIKCHNCAFHTTVDFELLP